MIQYPTMDKVICVVGPTAVGKTALAFKLAKKFNGELVNADSVQVYKGLDIISGKDISNDLPFTFLKELSISDLTVGYFNVDSTPIYLLDVVSPISSFSVAQFQSLGEKVISHIISKGKTPIIVGGTGLYIKSLIDGIPTKDISFDQNLRYKLERLSVEELQKILSVKKLSSMNESDIKNKRRLMRAIEIEQSGPVPILPKPAQGISVIQVGLSSNREQLKQRISKRVDERIKNGALNEAKKLFHIYEKLSPQVKNANGYKQLFAFLKDEITLDEAIERWKISEYQLSKNQMTWFKKDKRVEWFDVENENYKVELNIRLSKLSRI